VATLSLTQAEARELGALIRAERSSDELTWSSVAWLAVQTSRVDLVEFAVAPDMGWSMSVEHRDRLRANGFEYGPLRALHDLWLGEEEPSFSANALRLLHASACCDPSDFFEDLAGALEGDAGAVYARQILDDTADVDGVDDDNSPRKSVHRTGGNDD
jgi:hypothetical protein